MLRILPDPLVDDVALKAIRCTVRKAIRHRWFRRDKFDDLTQEIVVQLLSKRDRFDPCRASWATFCSMVATSFLARKRKQRRQAVDSLEPDEPLEDRHSVRLRFRALRSQYEWIELSEDFSQLISGLPDELRDFCELWLQGSNVSEAAAILGINRKTVCRRRRTLRKLITECFLDEYRYAERRPR